MENLGESLIHLIIARTDAKTAARVGCISNRWRSVASDDVVWSHFCVQDFAVFSRIDPAGSLCSSFKEAYEKWHAAFCMYPLSIVKRAKRCWETIRNWTSAHFPELADTLGHRASEGEIRNIEEKLGWQLPVPVRALYRFCNGQSIPHYRFSEDEQLAALGLLGGYRFYDQEVNVHLLPLHQILKLTNQCVAPLRLPGGSKYIVVAASSKANKFFFLDCSDGQLYVGTANLVGQRQRNQLLPRERNQLIPCVSHALVNIIEQDAMLLWLEEYGRRLEAGMYSVHKEDSIRSISLFPEKGPLCSKAVTKGVQVRASAVFVPELSNPQGDGYLFSYSIRMCLLPQESISQREMFSSCQLWKRHWIIRANGAIISEVNGEAVIGKYPLLHEGGDEFVYESCSPLPSSSGSIEGGFTFFPGRLRKPEGPEFTVQVAPFPLEIPEYIF
uniref:ApaG domain-containing protein n=1 Tax=Araucaria cunninghamii TaxID=56994 RepID=A0A0D6R196_ARACU